MPRLHAISGYGPTASNTAFGLMDVHVLPGATDDASGPERGTDHVTSGV